MEALAPFRAPFTRDAADPQPLPYLDSASNRERGAIAISARGVAADRPRCARAASRRVRVSASSFVDAYWTPAQLLAHHASNGCNLQAGDLMGSGTQSGPKPRARGARCSNSAQGGKTPFVLEATARQRTFLQDGDSRDPARPLRGRRARAASASAIARGTVMPAIER